MCGPYHPFVPNGYLSFEIGCSAIEVQPGITTLPQVAGSNSGGGNNIVDDGDIVRQAPLLIPLR
jgi:hypothetical protein